MENILARKATTIYGINTGFGKLSSVRIADNEHESLQRNLIRSHAVGIGPPLNAEAVHLTMLLKILSLCQGYSGVRVQVVEQLQAFLNGDILPIIPSQGSVEASGDLAALAATEMGNISERRIFPLLNGNAGLPAGLVSKPGLNSGLMMVQVTAAALASENKTLAHPASVDTIPTGADQEDHVSMSAWASRKLLQLVENLEHILAIEYITACPAAARGNAI